MSSLADQESAVQDFLYALQQHQRNCERLGRYTEAEIAKARLAELKQHEESRRRETLRARQLAEVLAVEEAHMMVRAARGGPGAEGRQRDCVVAWRGACGRRLGDKLGICCRRRLSALLTRLRPRPPSILLFPPPQEFQQFNLLQDAKGAAFEQNAQALMDALRARHADELRDFQQRLLSHGNAARHSKEYYTLRDVQEKLASGRNYAGAAKIKAKADELMAWEEEKHANERQVEMLNKEKLYKQKLALEAEALKRRIAQGRAEANRARQTDLERILQRYSNVKGELEAHQRTERSKLDKEISLEKKVEAKGGSGGGGGAGAKGGGAVGGGGGASRGLGGGGSTALSLASKGSGRTGASGAYR